MSRSKADRNSLGRAAIASLALHLLAVPLFTPAGAAHDTRFARAEAGGDETTHVSTITFDRAHRRPSLAALERPRPHHASPPVARIARIARVATPAKPAREPVGPVAARHVASAGGGGRSAEARTTTARRAGIALALETAAPERDAAPRALPPIVREAETPAQPSAPAKPTTIPPTSAAPDTPVAVAVAPHDGDVAPGGWGQSFANPLVADEATLAGLRAKYRGLRAIAIDVDASGHATRVEIPESVTGDAREELARILSGARYVPAECNGLRCTGKLVLVL